VNRLSPLRFKKKYAAKIGAEFPSLDPGISSQKDHAPIDADNMQQRMGGRKVEAMRWLGCKQGSEFFCMALFPQA
jgi:hypothetical protein